MEARNYRTLTVTRTGFCLNIDIADRNWDIPAVQDLSADLSDICEQAGGMHEARVVLIAFKGDMGVSGPAVPVDEVVPVRLADPVASLPQPVIAAVRGNAIGLGLELALACDIRIGTVDSRFGMPQVSEGAVPFNGGTQRLPRLIGLGPAMHMILTGEPVDTDTALRLGLVHRVVTADELMPAAADLARNMAVKSPLSTSFAKEAVYTGRDLTLEQGLSKELDLYLQLFGTEDRMEGITAFRQKRTPEFKGE